MVSQQLLTLTNDKGGWEGDLSLSGLHLGGKGERDAADKNV